MPNKSASKWRLGPKGGGFDTGKLICYACDDTAYAVKREDQMISRCCKMPLYFFKSNGDWVMMPDDFEEFHAKLSELT